jgi:cell division protein FtsQ
MSAGSTIRKVLFISFWILIGGGMLSLLLAAITTKNKGVIKEYKISFRGDGKTSFITAKDVEQLLLRSANGHIKGYPVASLDLHRAEKLLEENSWIDAAELYFDSGNTLHVTVSEKKPVARIFSLSGETFFIDSLGRKIPVSTQATAKLPVFTGFTGTKKMTNADSLLLNDIRLVANFIVNDPLWSAQVAQVDITADKKFEIVPLIGNHLVRIGGADNLDKKFNRLRVFYQQVLSKTSFDKYKIIDVQYKGQVVASRSEGNARVDSILLRRNVEKLLKQSMEAEKDTVIRPLPIIRLEADSADIPDPELKDKQLFDHKNTRKGTSENNN